MLTIVERMAALGRGKLYSGPIDSLSGGLYCLATVAALDILHDAWFYWTHRLLHWRPLYRCGGVGGGGEGVGAPSAGADAAPPFFPAHFASHIHATHHESTAPTPFTGYSFHVVEAAIVFANEIIVAHLFPIHAGLHRAYHLWTTVIHIGGHAGYEIAPFIPSLASLASRLAGRGGSPPALNTVQHHDLHHRFPQAHFSLYFTLWDAACGTEHAAYRTLVSPEAAHLTAAARNDLVRAAAAAARKDAAAAKAAAAPAAAKAAAAPAAAAGKPAPAAARPSSPGIGAWRPLAGGRRSVRLAASAAA